MKIALGFAVAAVVSTFAASGASAQQGPGLQYFADHMQVLGIAESQRPILALPGESRPFFAPGARRDGAVAESSPRVEQRPRAVR